MITNANVNVIASANTRTIHIEYSYFKLTTRRGIKYGKHSRQSHPFNKSLTNRFCHSKRNALENVVCFFFIFFFHLRFKVFSKPKSSSSNNNNNDNLKQKSERNTAKSVVVVVVAAIIYFLLFVVVVVASFSATYYKIKLESRNERSFARLNGQRCDITSLAINGNSKSNNNDNDSNIHSHIHTYIPIHRQAAAALCCCCCSIIIIYQQ